MKHLFLWLVISVFSSGCSKKPNQIASESPKPASEQIIGKWEMGAPENLIQNKKSPTIKKEESISLSFETTQDVTINFAGTIIDFNYRMDEDSIYLVNKKDEKPSEIKYKFIKDLLILEIDKTNISFQRKE